MKRCTKCRQDKPLNSFHRDRKARDGLTLWCASCTKENYERNRGRNKLTSRRGQIRRLYGLELEEYVRLKAAGCTVCGSTKRVVMDHCHATNSFRAPLCNGCNTALGQVGDDPERLEALARYVRAMSVAGSSRPIPVPVDPRKILIDQDDLRSMYEGGMTQQEIADVYCCVPALITRKMKEFGIQARGRGRRPPGLRDPLIYQRANARRDELSKRGSR